MEENKMGVMPVGKLLISTSLPMIFSMFVQSLYNIVDSIFVGRFDINALTAVSLAFSFQNLMMAFATGTGVGMNAMLSKSLGEGDLKKVGKAAGNGFVLQMLSALMFAVVGLLFSGIFFRVQNPNPEIVTYGKQYLMICSGFAFGIFGQVTFERMLQATGNAIYSMISQLSGAVINIILDPLLIFGLCGFPKLGVIGAAVATVIGQFFAMGLAYYFNRRYNHYIALNRENCKLDKYTVKRIYSIGIPSILMVAIMSVANFSINKILIKFDGIKTAYGAAAGTLATTALGIYFKLQSFVFMPIFGLNNGMVPIIAYNYGAKHPDRIRKTKNLSILYAIAIMAVGLLIFQTIPDKLIALFNDSEELIKIGVPTLRITSLGFIVAGYSVVSSSVYQALGKGTYSLWISAARQLIIILPLAWLFSLLGNVDLVWFAFPAADLASVFICIFCTKRLFKQLNI